MTTILLYTLSYVAVILISFIIGLRNPIKRQVILGIAVIILSNIWFIIIAQYRPSGISEIVDFVMLSTPNIILIIVASNVCKSKKWILAALVMVVATIGFMNSFNAFYSCELIESALVGLHSGPFGSSIQKQFEELKIENTDVIERIDVKINSISSAQSIDVKILRNKNAIRSSINVTVHSEWIGQGSSLTDTLLEKDAELLLSIIRQLPKQEIEYAKQTLKPKESYWFEIFTVNYISGELKYFDIGNADESVPESYSVVKDIMKILKSVNSSEIRTLVTEIDKQM